MGRYRHYIKKHVEPEEYSLHDFIYKLGIVNTPRIVRYNENNKRLVLEDVGNDNIANIYGENPEDIPQEIFDAIREIILKLYQYGILYPDITGYNFIEHKGSGKIYIIDFEHAVYNSNKTNSFVEKFIDGCNTWNPEFL